MGGGRGRAGEGEEDKVDRGRGGKTTSGNGQFAKSQKKVGNREECRALVVKPPVVPPTTPEVQVVKEGGGELYTTLHCHHQVNSSLRWATT